MISIKQIIKQINENIDLENIHLNYHHGQNDFVLVARENNKVIGKVNYSLFEDQIHLGMVEVQPLYRGKGVGKQLIRWLAKQYGYENIVWGYTTPEGEQLKRSMDLELNK
jgi:N-acetylglutamate synthase-like GNAT family acetyltransferase